MKNQVYCCRVALPVTAAEAFDWHGRPGALERLIPPWENVRVVARTGGLEKGARVELINRVGPWRVRWVAEHTDYQPGRLFRDVQLRGPFAFWEHTHRFSTADSGMGVLEDHIEYRVPGGMVGQWLGGSYVRKKIDAMFLYRHTTTVDDLAAHARCGAQSAMHVAVTGSSGLVGVPLTAMLTTGGHRVTRIVRGEAQGRGAVSWDPLAGHFDASPLQGIDAVVHLAGENSAAGRWTPSQKGRRRDSRVRGTRALCEALSRLKTPPRIFVSASSIGYYGDRGSDELDESASRGEGSLADVAAEWERATEPAMEAGIRVVHLRFGVVLTPRGGALARMLAPFRLAAGGRIGSGEQFWSWVSIDDAIGAIHHALITNELSGPVNAVSPSPVTNKQFAKTLAHVLRRPAITRLPASVAKWLPGQMAEALLLASTRVRPQRLMDTGYAFRQPTLDAALRHVLGRPAP